MAGRRHRLQGCTHQRVPVVGVVGGRKGSVLFELHRARAAPTGAGTQVDRVAPQSGHRNQRADDDRLAAILPRAHLAPSRVEVPCDVDCTLSWNDSLNKHQRLDDDRPCLAQGALGCQEAGYQLGYEPSDPALDGKYRKVRVKVNRRGARVLYQQGYYARNEFTTFDRRAVISQSRVEAALRYPRLVDDLKLNVTASAGRTPDRRHQMTVQVNIDPSTLQVTSMGGERLVSLDVGVFCVDRGQLVGYIWRRMTLNLDDNRYAQVLQGGLGFTVIVPLQRSAKQVKAVVYDYASDRVGSALPAVK